MVCSAACPAPRPRRRFMQLLPAIVRTARYSLRHLRGEALQDALQEVIANAFVAFVALVRRGKMDLAYGSVLGRLAAAQFRDGRRVGNSLCCHEVLSPYAQRLKNFNVESLDRREKDDEDAWREVLVEDKTAGPFDIVRTKLDMDAWLHSLPSRDRKVAQFLSLGNRTSDAARKFGVSEGRISQMRRSLEKSWTDFNEGNAA
jgi:hypothetical protein